MEVDKALAGDLAKSAAALEVSVETNERDESGSGPPSRLPFSFSAEEEKKVVGKLDRWVVCTMFMLFMLSFLDRSNIGNANTAGLSRDLGLSSDQYEWLLTIFYIGYIIGQPLVLLWKVFPPHLYVSVLTFCWGGFAILQATATGWSGLMALRFFLGVAETAFGPGVPYYLSFMYTRRELGLRQGFFLGAAPIATAYAGTLAYGLTHTGATVDKWRLLFLVEGAPAILAMPFAYFMIPDRVETARFLTAREKDIAVARTVRREGTGLEQGLKLDQVLLGLTDTKAWITALMYFSANVSYSSLPVFLPTILSGMGFGSIRAQGLTAPPYLASFLVLMVVAYLGDRRLDRTIFIIPLGVVAGVGYVVLATVRTNAVRYFAVYLAACGIFPIIALTLPLVSGLHASQSRRGGAFVLLNIVGQCGPFLGTRLFPAREGPYYTKGFFVCAGFMFFHVFLTSTLRFLLIRSNNRKDKEHGKISRDAALCYSLDEDDHPRFRYAL